MDTESKMRDNISHHCTTAAVGQSLIWNKCSEGGNGNRAISREATPSVFFYKNDEELIKRIELLLASLQAGNDSNHVKSEISAINDLLLKHGVINDAQHYKIFNTIYHISR